MKKVLYLIILLGVKFAFIHAQCNNQYLSLPDTFCPVKTIPVANNGAPDSEYLFDFNPGGLAAIPEITNLAGSQPKYSFKAIKDKGNYYCWAPFDGAGYLFRSEFGNSFDNPLNTINTNISGFQTASLFGFDMVRDTGRTYIGFGADYTGKDLFKIEFDSINDDVLNYTPLHISGIDYPRCVKIINNSVFITEFNHAYLTRVDFNQNYHDTISTTQITLPFVNGSSGFDIVYDCVYNEYIGFIGNNITGQVIRLDFGSSVLNNNPIITPVTSTAFGDMRGLELNYDNGKWYFLTNNYNSARFLMAELGDIKNTLPVIVFDTTTTLLNSTYGISTVYDSSVYHTLLSDYSGSNFTQFKFRSLNNFSDAWVGSPNYSNFSYPAGSSGYYFVNTIVIDSNQVKSYSKDSIYITIPPPVASFKTSATCDGSPVQFVDMSEICFGSIVGWNWDFGDSFKSNLQSPLHQYASIGVYNVTLTVYAANGDSGVYSQNIYIVPLPVSDFLLPFFACANSPVQFTDLSLAPSDSVTEWTWIFGDGDSAFVQNPIHAYSDTGNFDVVLIVHNSQGCADSIDYFIAIIPSPIAAFSFLNTCNNDYVLFLNSTDSNSLINVTYNWNFGDNSFSNLSDPNHLFLNGNGNYAVNLIATGSNGCADSVVQIVTISSKANVNFSTNVNQACVGNEITFTDSSFAQPGDSIINYLWNFGDASPTETGKSVQHTYQNSGTYFVTLTVTTPTSCDTTLTKVITVIGSPIADFVFTNVCNGNANSFADASLAQPGDPLAQFNWQFGDTFTGNGASVSHPYNSAGVYDALLTITSQAGCTDTITKQVTSYELPVSNFTNSNISCQNDSTHFVDLTTVVNDTILSWMWEFENGLFNFSQNPSFVFTTTGFDSVTLVTTTVKGCSDTIQKVVNVLQSPVPDFTFTSVCEGSPTQFTFLNLDTTIHVNYYYWIFGDGGFSGLPNPSHLYNNSGLYNARVIATASNGCSSAKTNPVTVNANPSASFAVNNPCSGQITMLSDSSQVSSGSIVSWLWVLNGIDSLTTNDIIFSNQNPGLVNVYLSVVSDAGCKDSTQSNVAINLTPIADFTFSPQYATPGENVSFNSISVASTFLWNFGDTNFGNSNPVIHAYADTGKYNVTLIVQSNEGCADTSYKLFSVLYPHVDIAVTNVVASIANNLLTLKATLFNLSNIDINKIQIKAEVQNIPAIYEFPNISLPVSAPIKDYIFQSKVYVADNIMPEYFCIEADKPNGLSDENFNNNRMCRNLTTEFSISNIEGVPVSNNLIVNFNLPFETEVRMVVYDALGKIVLNTDAAKYRKGFNSISTDVTFLASGIYVLRLYANDETQSVKFSKN